MHFGIEGTGEGIAAGKGGKKQKEREREQHIHGQLPLCHHLAVERLESAWEAIEGQFHAPTGRGETEAENIQGKATAPVPFLVLGENG